MAKHGKKYAEMCEKIPKGQIFPVKEALAKVKELAYAQFDESVDIDVNLGIDSSKSDQMVRGSVLLPHGSGKAVKILVFAKGDHADEARKAGADYVGAEDLVDKISAGWMEFDFAIATPDLMGLVGKIAKILGPKGLLPNKKLGTVTFDIAHIVTDLKKGRVFFKNDKQGIVHFSLGRISFDKDKLYQNLVAFTKSLLAAKPATSKGKFLQKMILSSSMGAGIAINPDDVLRA